MRRALELAERGAETVSPNPLVGCVVVSDGQVVGQGWHERAGQPHAEVHALAAAGERARGSTVYVTLEPCDHHGRTGPCSKALIEAAVAEVVVALGDPHPTAGGGAETLRAAGIGVRVGTQADVARRQNAVFLHGLEHGRPFVIGKVATSLDGRIAAADGTSQWLTGGDARREAHRLRARVDAVLVGSETVLADDPRLTVRLDTDTASAAQPLRVVLDARGRVGSGMRVLDGEAPTLWCVSSDAAVPAGLPPAVAVEVFPATTQGGIDPRAVLTALWARDVRSVLVEGGAHVLSSFVAADLVDRFVVHQAPLLLGSAGRPAVFGGPATLADARRWHLDGVERASDDVLMTYTPRRAPAAVPAAPAAAQAGAR